MIPVSSSNYQQGCNPISSNCVVWQGPDLPIIGLCKGDSISDVVAKLATELTSVKDAVSISGIDLSCLQLSTAPTTTEELFQTIVTEICSLDSRCDTLEGGSSGSVVQNITASLPVCLQYTNLENDVVTELPIDQYAELVAAKVCAIISDITTINTSIDDHEVRITTLEGATGSEYTTPQITPNCVLPSVATDIDVVLDELEDQFCTLNTTLGGSTELLDIATKQCAGLNDAAKLSGSGTMSGITGWNTTVNSVAESLQNMWLTICDMRSAINTIQDTCCSLTCDDVTFSVSGSFSGTTLTLDFSGTIIPGAMSECSPTGATVVISDGSNTYNDDVEVLVALAGNNTATIDISGTQLNQYSDYTVTVNLCVTDGSITCNKEKSIAVTNPEEEPAPTTSYYVLVTCDSPGDPITASYIGTTLTPGQAVHISGSTNVGVCYTVVDTATGGATATIIETFADCASCNL